MRKMNSAIQYRDSHAGAGAADKLPIGETESAQKGVSTRAR